ncbi:MAG: hypothetical protein A2Z74_02040 [Chloroflexi bacterium RBG_13_46_9]|nr:MAG: hypothetical protein A2Z74_02040 [Chloroflexi bacterium RBG_13_46_9]
MTLPMTLPAGGTNRNLVWSIGGGAVNCLPQTIWDTIGRGFRLSLRRPMLQNQVLLIMPIINPDFMIGKPSAAWEYSSVGRTYIQLH